MFGRTVLSAACVAAFIGLGVNGPAAHAAGTDQPVSATVEYCGGRVTVTDPSAGVSVALTAPDGTSAADPATVDPGGFATIETTASVVDIVLTPVAAGAAALELDSAMVARACETDPALWVSAEQDGTDVVLTLRTADARVHFADLTINDSWYPLPNEFVPATVRFGMVGAEVLGCTFVLDVTGADGFHFHDSAVPITGCELSAAPELTATVPTISGDAIVGSKLTAEPGVWAPQPDHVAYRWERNSVAISGATRASYLLTNDDAGATITVTTTGTKAGYPRLGRTSSGMLIADLTALVAGTPTISGKAKVGATLTATAGTSTPGAPIPSFTYRWNANGTVIGAATGKTYVLTPAEAGKTITVSVAVQGSVAAAKTSKATAKVAKGSLVTSPATISGTARVGKDLSAATGSWLPGGVTFAYQWYRSGKRISTAKQSTYTLGATDLGKKMTVKVTGSSPGYTSASKTSRATVKVVRGVLTVGTPTISGTAQAGLLLTASAGDWGPGTVTYHYQWYRSGAAIKGATKATYTPFGADVTKVLSVKVSGSKAGFTSAAATSAATTAVATGTLAPGTPTISGTVKVGQKLTARPGTWGPGSVVFHYQWRRDGAAIATATGATYVLTSADLNKAVTVEVTGAENGFTVAAATSVSVTAVA